MLFEITSLKIDNESHYLLIIPAIFANVKKIAINSRMVTRIALIISTIFANVKKNLQKMSESRDTQSLFRFENSWQLSEFPQQYRAIFTSTGENRTIRRKHQR